ncbi:MAG: transglycosylase SLT domain-containing protein [Actinomycetota bacterium]|nr:transglycosylase SLT domain-containing protein [Actinomycetota bacterium]
MAGLLCVAGQAGFTPASSGSGYLVRVGDSLWAISRANGVTVDQLAQANHMRPSDLLLAGRHLTIPRAATARPTTSSGPSNNSGTARPDPNFCATFTPSAGQRGVLPDGLTANPSRLALRPLFVHWARAYGISPALSEAIAWQESGWQSNVVSSAQAVGVGQLLPSTADFVSQLLIGRTLDIHAASDNIQMSARYLAYLQGEEGGNLCRTVAAYYEGSLNMSRYGVFNETQPYIMSVEALIPRFQ